jgi:predicted PurR-regulated permease PerM
MPDSGVASQPDSKPSRLIALLWVVVVAILVSFAFFASSLCITFLLAGFLAILVDPIPTALEKWRVPRALSAALVIVCGMLFLGLAVYASYGKIDTFIDNIPDYADRIQDVIRPIQQNIEKVQKTAGTLNPVTTPQGKRIPEVRVSQAPSWPPT